MAAVAGENRPLAVSIGLPPPKPTTQSNSPAWSAASAASTEATVGSGTVSEKIVPRAPALLSRSSNVSVRPLLTRYGSVTTKGRDRPSWPRISGSSREAPAPMRISRGRAIEATIC